MNQLEAQLYYWMSHIGNGTNNRLYNAVSSLRKEWPEKKRKTLVRTFMDRVTRLGHSTPNVSSGWQMRSPSLTLLPQGEDAFWRGGVAPDLVRQVEQASERMGCRLEIEYPEWTPPRLLVYGSRLKIETICSQVGVRFEEEAARLSAASLPDLRQALHTWQEKPLPTSAELESFNFETSEWHPYKPEGDNGIKLALRYRDRYHSTRYFVMAENKILSAPDKCQAVYVASHGVLRCAYDEASAQFKAFQRLSPRFALPLCLCTGRLSQLSADGSELYEEVTPDIGRLMMQRLGQTPDFAKIYWF